MIGNRARLALWIAGGGSLLAAWVLHDYRLPHQAQAPTLNAGRPFEHRRRVDAHGIEQVWTPAGCFEQGASVADDPRAHADETPRHTTCIRAGFWIDRFEVTNRGFDEFVRAGWYRDRSRWPEPAWKAIREQQLPYYDGLPRNYRHPDQPRVKVNWYEAEAYARWRGGSGPLRVLKGGAWGGITGGSPSDVRGARRLRWPAESGKSSHGFRVASPGP